MNLSAKRLYQKSNSYARELARRNQQVTYSNVLGAFAARTEDGVITISRKQCQVIRAAVKAQRS